MTPGYKTSKFYVTLLTVAGLVTASAAASLPPRFAVIAIAASTAAYAIARGLAKIDVDGAIKKGYKTTEFYVTILSVVGLVAASIGDVVDPVYGGVAAGIASAAYAISRGLATLDLGERKTEVNVEVEAHIEADAAELERILNEDSSEEV